MELSKEASVKPFTRNEIRQLAIKDAAESNNFAFSTRSADEFFKITDRQTAFKHELTKNFSLEDKALFFKIMAEEVEIQTLITRNHLMLFKLKNGVAFDYQQELNEINAARVKILEKLPVEDKQEFLDYMLLEAQTANQKADQKQEQFNKEMQPIKNTLIGFQVIVFIVVFVLVFFVIRKLAG